MGLIILAVLIYLIVRYERAQRSAKEEADSYNPPPIYDARFANEEEMKAGGVFEQRPGGIPIGWIGFDRWWGLKKRTIWHNPVPTKLKGHIVYGAMGSGKTSGKLTPEQIYWPGSLIDFTATAESAASTCDFRKRFGPIFMINPNHDFWPHLKHIPEIRINPCAPYWMKPGLLDSRAGALVHGAVPDIDHHNKFFDVSSRAMAKDIMMAECELNPRLANIARVAFIAHEDPVHYCKWAALRTRNDDLRAMLKRWIPTEAEPPKSINEVRQNTCAHLAPFLSPGVKQALSQPDVMLGSLRQKVMTIIVVNSLEHLGAEDTDKFRTFVLSALLAEIQSYQFDGNVQLAVQVDELAQYPRIDSVLRAQSSLRKYGAYMSCAINDYSSLSRIYGEEGCQSFMNNAGLVQFMSPVRDDKGVKFLTHALGQCEVHTFNKSWGNPYPGSNGHSTVNTTASQSHRPVLTEEEIRRLPPGTQLVWMDGVARPIFCYVRPYYLTNDEKVTKPNIYHKGSR